MALRDRALSHVADDREIVNVPEWDDDEGPFNVELRSVSIGLRNTLATAARDKEGSLDANKFQLRLLIASAYDPDTGDRVFMPTDYDSLLKQKAGPIDRLVKDVMRLSGLTDSDSDDGESAGEAAVAAAGKDSSSTVSSGSGSSSPSDSSAQSVS